MEIWKDIKGFEGRYQISTYGRVKSLERWVDAHTHKKHLNEYILKAAVTDKGYLKVRIIDNYGKKRSLNIHREVAYAFIANPQNKKEVNHIDGNKQNNCVENLEWVTASENVKHAFRNGLNKGSRSKRVIQRDKKGNVIKIWRCMLDVEKSGIMNNWTMRKVRHNKIDEVNGYLWSVES